MNGTLLKTINIRSKAFDVYVSPEGVFFSYPSGKKPEDRWSDEDQYDSTQIEARSMLELAKKLEHVTKLPKLRIPFVRYYDGRSYEKGLGRLRHGCVTGVHLTNNNLLVEWEDGKKEQNSSYNSEQFLQLTPAEEKEYMALQKLLKDTERNIERFEKRHAIDMRKEVEKAQK